MLPKNNKVIIIGFGKAGRLHYNVYKSLKFNVYVVNKNPNNKIFFEKQNILFERNLKKALSKFGEPFIFDICSPTKFHIKNLKEILEFKEIANIIIEKPIANNLKEAKEAICLQKKFPKVKIFINENYRFSSALELAKTLIKKYGLESGSFYCEFSKNRNKDIKNGRFVDNKLHGLDIEFPHMISIAQLLGFDLFIPVNSLLTVKRLPKEINNFFYNEAQFTYKAHFKNKVKLIQNLDGRIYFKDEYLINQNEKIGLYRIIKIENKAGTSLHIRFDPININDRYKAKVVITYKSKKIKEFIISDDSLRKSLLNATYFFDNKISSNPSSIEEAVKVIDVLFKLKKSKIK